MKTLFITDLDGTLLNDEAEVSGFTKTTINRLIREGMFFSVATARSSITALPILEGLNINIPVVLMNGVLVFDIKEKQFIKHEILPKAVLKEILRYLDVYDITGFLFTVENNEVETYYENLDMPHRKNFSEERVKKYGKPLKKASSFSELCGSQVIYLSFCETYEVLLPLSEKLKGLTDIHFEFYRDVYFPELFYLQIFSKNASKQKGVEFLRSRYGFEKIISFGDNLNDLPMFKASDLCLAVENAKTQVKESASEIIRENTRDGVAAWLNENFKLHI